MEWLSSHIRYWMGNRAGNIAVTTAICALPLFGMIGVAIDYAIALSAKAKLDAAADAAVVAAIGTAQSTIQGGGTTASAIAQGQAQGAKVFLANAGAVPFTTVPTPNINVARSGQTLTATITYASASSNNFGKMFGVAQSNLQGSAASSTSMTTYINYYILVDISQSMGIGATQTDMTNLYARTQLYGNSGEGDPGCVFGCHVASGSATYSNEYLAHNVTPYITLRIDAAKLAVQNIIALAQSAAGTAANIDIALYTMSANPVSGSVLNTVAALSSNYSSLTTAAGTIDLGNNLTCCGYGDSDFPDSLTAFNTVLTSQGDGSSPSAPLNYVFIVTDGLQDTYGASCTWGHCIQTLDPTSCTPLKAKATVGVIYTTYSPVYLNNNPAYGYENSYAVLAASTVPAIPAALQACATSASYYYEASDGSAITTAMQKLFASTTQLARLTR